MPSFHSGKVTAYESNNVIQRQFFVIDNMLDAIRVQVLRLMSVGMFVPSKVFTKLNNSVVLKFGGDKGGKFMKFKFGVTIMNTPFANSLDSFDVLGMLDAEDSFYNLKKAFLIYGKKH